MIGNEDLRPTRDPFGFYHSWSSFMETITGAYGVSEWASWVLIQWCWTVGYKCGVGKRAYLIDSLDADRAYDIEEFKKACGNNVDDNAWINDRDWLNLLYYDADEHRGYYISVAVTRDQEPIIREFIMQKQQADNFIVT
jgi:hypothetical protein